MQKEDNTLSILGPEYSYTHILALSLFPKSEFVFCSSIPEIFNKVANDEASVGLSPIENLLHGSVRDSILGLQKHKLKINNSYDLPIKHCLASQFNSFNKIASHPQGLGQCSLILEKLRKKGIEIIETQSTSGAMQLASKDKDIAAIGSEKSAKHFNLKIIEKDIGDSKDNVTRFILFSKKENENENVKGKDIRTSLLIIPEKDRPGLLYDILSVFKGGVINLTKLESIPSGKKLGQYEFFIEAEGCLKDNNFKVAMNILKEDYNVINFGSYELERVED